MRVRKPLTYLRLLCMKAVSGDKVYHLFLVRPLPSPFLIKYIAGSALGAFFVNFKLPVMQYTSPLIPGCDDRRSRPRLRLESGKQWPLVRILPESIVFPW